MKIPTREECLRWYRDLGTRENIIDHVKFVNKIAVFLGHELIKKGISLNMDIVAMHN